MSLFGDAPRFGRGTKGTLLGGEVFVDVMPQTQSTVGPGSYNTTPRGKTVPAPKMTRSDSVPKSPRRWNQPQVHSQESRTLNFSSSAGCPPSNRHSYLYSVMSHGVEVYRSDVGLIPGPGAYTGKLVGHWDDERKRNRSRHDGFATERGGGAPPSPSRFITSARRPDANLLATAVVRNDVLFVHKTPCTPGPGMYSRLYDRRSPWITRSFNVRVRSGNSPVRARPLQQHELEGQGPAANNAPLSSRSHGRSATPQPVRAAWPANTSKNEAAAFQNNSKTHAAPSSSSRSGHQYQQQPRSMSAGRSRSPPLWGKSVQQQEATQRSMTRDRRMSTRAQELEAWWGQVTRRTYSPRESTIPHDQDGSPRT